MTNQVSVRVFLDFDGTISSRDAGAYFFNHFSSHRNRGTVKLWVDQKISSRECLWRECSFVTAGKEEILASLTPILPREGFGEFLRLMEERGYPFHILSDGLDFYIESFLERHGYGRLDIHSNKANFDNGRLYPSFPYFSLGCGLCGTCKGERIVALSQPGELRIFIGDGFSDRCALKEADLIFARADLAELCRQKEVDYIEYDDFFSVADYFRRSLR